METYNKNNSINKKETKNKIKNIKNKASNKIPKEAVFINNPNNNLNDSELNLESAVNNIKKNVKKNIKTQKTDLVNETSYKQEEGIITTSTNMNNQVLKHNANNKINANSNLDSLETQDTNNKIILNTNLLYNFGANNIPKTDLSGHIIVSSPNSSGDALLSKTLIYIASHTASGAFGFILNNFIGNISWDTIVKNNHEIFKNTFVDMYYGGIEEQGKGFILHSQDYNSNVIFSSNLSKINVSHNNDIIKNIVYEGKPKDYLFLTGCTLWGQGQLEKEMMMNFWIVLDPNLTRHFVFNPIKDEAWSLALNIIGINPNKYISKIGTD